ncbi:hypothetical protein [Alkalihalobacillus sp. CinArs1]|uniref:hypothetical protein n=1 Tax=Alkalihalobacillus sp. CinArs1 TaxID=2995314 RepID=UPI0022DE88CD|nr:hypothetical protein [Alkalihalobacillus sp. CinArs1]
MLMDYILYAIVEGEHKKCVQTKGFQRLSGLNAHLRFSDLAAVGRPSSRFTLSPEHKERVQTKGFQRLSGLNAHLRFSGLAATRRNYDISLFQQNTKSVFYFKSSNISVSKRSPPPF